MIVVRVGVGDSSGRASGSSTFRRSRPDGPWGAGGTEAGRGGAGANPAVSDRAEAGVCFAGGGGGAAGRDIGRAEEGGGKPAVSSCCGDATSVGGGGAWMLGQSPGPVERSELGGGASGDSPLSGSSSSFGALAQSSAGVFDFLENSRIHALSGVRLVLTLISAR